MPRILLRAAALLIAAPGVALAGSAAALERDEHPELAGSVKAFHDVLRVDWHAEKGAERNAAACRNVGTYIALSREIATRPAPATANGPDWGSATAGMSDASVALGAYCASGVTANVEAGLATLHDRFHDLMSAMKGEEDVAGQ